MFKVGDVVTLKVDGTRFSLISYGNNYTVSGINNSRMSLKNIDTYLDYMYFMSDFVLVAPPVEKKKIPLIKFGGKFKHGMVVEVSDRLDLEGKYCVVLYCDETGYTVFYSYRLNKFKESFSIQEHKMKLVKDINIINTLQKELDEYYASF